MGGHLAAAGGRVSARADGLQQHFFRGDAQGQAEGAVAIIGIKPIVARPQERCRRRSGWLRAQRR